MSLIDTLDPGCTCKIWKVSYGGWYDGQFDTFWLKRNAIRRYRQVEKRYEFVELVNTIDEETLLKGGRYWAKKDTKDD